MVTLLNAGALAGVVLILAFAIMKRYPQSKQFFGILTIVIGALFVATTLSSTITVINGLSRGPEPIPFNRDGWNSSRLDSRGNFTYVRYKMVSDLMKRYDFHKWAMDEVEDLLNKPDKVKEEDQKIFIHYDLGNGLDFLIFELDNDRRVKRYWVYDD